MKRLIPILLLLVSGAVQADRIDEGYSLINPSDIDFSNKENRLIHAQKILDTLITPFQDATPKLSPKEEAWLKSEQERIRRLTGNSKTANEKQLLESREYQLTKVYVSLSLLRHSLNKIGLNPNEEARWWLEVSIELIEGTAFDSLNYLRSKGQFTCPDPDISWVIRWTCDDFWEIDYWPRKLGKNILVYILRPHLQKTRLRMSL
jgi:hypothetical protein